MYKIAVSPEELNAFGQSVENFKNGILLECENLQQQTKAISDCVDDATALALMRPVQEVARIISDKDEALKSLAENAYAYAGKVRLIQQRIEQEKGNKSTLREKAAGVTVGAIMYNNVAAAGSDYDTMAGRRIATVKTVADVTSAVGTVGKIIAGASITPNVPLDDAANVAIQFIDSVIGSSNYDARIDRSATPIPQEQIDSHMLVIDDPSDPWGTTK